MLKFFGCVGFRVENGDEYKEERLNCAIAGTNRDSHENINYKGISVSGVEEGRCSTNIQEWMSNEAIEL